MSTDREPDDSGTTHPGPITPPSLGEIYQISQRRQRTRYRVVQGSLAAVVVAGVGLGLASRDTSPTSSTEQEAATEPDVSGETEPPTTTGTVPLQPTLDLAGTCQLQLPDDDAAAWLVEGQQVYDVDSPVPFSEVEQLAAAWETPVDEVAALVGLADRSGVRLDVASIDEAFDGWYDRGHNGDQLRQLADAWNVSTISVKVLAHIGDPAVEVALVGCDPDGG